MLEGLLKCSNHASAFQMSLSIANALLTLCPSAFRPFTTLVGNFVSAMTKLGYNWSWTLGIITEVCKFFLNQK